MATRCPNCKSFVSPIKPCKKCGLSEPVEQELDLSCEYCESADVEILSVRRRPHLKGRYEGQPFHGVIWYRVHCSECRQVSITKVLELVDG